MKKRFLVVHHDKKARLNLIKFESFNRFCLLKGVYGQRRWKSNDLKSKFNVSLFNNHLNTSLNHTNKTRLPINNTNHTNNPCNQDNKDNNKDDNKDNKDNNKDNNKDDNKDNKNKGFFERMEERFDALRQKEEAIAVAKKRLTVETKTRADRFFDQRRVLEDRKELIKSAFREGYYDNAKQVARFGPKLWDASIELTKKGVARRMPDFVGETIDGAAFGLLKMVARKQTSLVAIYFNQFGEDQVQTFLDPFSRVFGGDPRVGIVEINVNEQPLKAPVLKMVQPYIKWKLPKERRARYMILHQSVTAQRAQIGINNNVLGWINLVDGDGFIRWQAHGDAKPAELATLLRLSKDLLGSG